MSCSVGHRCGLDLALLWLRWRPAAAAPIRPLVWEHPYAAGAALKTHTHTEGKENTAGEVPASEDAADFVKWTLALLANFGLGIVTRIQWQLSE